MAEDFHHALKFKYDLCIGCSHCTGVCPTSAIHVENGHPVLDPNRCVDCGRCYVACPMNAIFSPSQEKSSPCRGGGVTPS